MTQLFLTLLILGLAAPVIMLRPCRRLIDRRDDA